MEDNGRQLQALKDQGMLWCVCVCDFVRFMRGTLSVAGARVWSVVGALEVQRSRAGGGQARVCHRPARLRIQRQTHRAQRLQMLGGARVGAPAQQLRRPGHQGGVPLPLSTLRSPALAPCPSQPLSTVGMSGVSSSDTSLLLASPLSLSFDGPLLDAI